MEKPQEKKNNIDEKKGYYYLYAEKTPHTPFLEAAVTKYCKEKGEALDIGAGTLRDTKYLLENGFKVTAIDPSPASFELASAIPNPNLTFVQEVVGKYDLPLNHFVLVNAQSILFWFPRERFDFIIERIKHSLKPGGVFCASFIGNADDWAKSGEVTTVLSKEEIINLFDGFEVKQIKENEYDAPSAQSVIEGTNKPKHWHWIAVILQKREIVDQVL